MGLWSTKVAYYAKAARTAYTHRPTDHLLKLCLTINLIILVIYSPSHPSSLPYPYLDIVANSLNARTPSAPILEMSDFRWDRTSELENRHTEVQSLSPPFISHDSLTSQTIQYTQPTDQLSDDQDDWAILAYAAEVKDLEMAERAIRRLSKLGNEQSEAEGGQVSSNPECAGEVERRRTKLTHQTQQRHHGRSDNAHRRIWSSSPCQQINHFGQHHTGEIGEGDTAPDSQETQQGGDARFG